MPEPDGATTKSGAPGIKGGQLYEYRYITSLSSGDGNLSISPMWESLSGMFLFGLGFSHDDASG